MKKAYAAPTVLKPFNKGDRSIVRVVIETPKGSRNKYKFEPKLCSFILSKVLPDGMVFPFDFGFIPSTSAEDGDPLDVLLLMDDPAFPGCVIESELIGVIEGEQVEEGKTVRNDRLVAIANENHAYADLKDIKGMNKTLIKDIGQFFTNYHQLRGSKFRVLGVKGRKQARQLLEKAIKKNKAA